MFHLQKMSYVTCPDDKTRHTTRFFQWFKTAQLSYLHSFGVAMTTRKLALQPLDEQPTRRAHEFDPCTYVEVVSPAFFFLNDDKSKYVSVGFYPAQNCDPLVELGGTKLLPLVLVSEYVTILADRLSALVEVLCLNEHFHWVQRTRCLG